MTLLTRIPFCLSALLLAVSARAQEIPLYAAAVADHRPVAVVAVPGPSVTKSTPVLDAAKKAEGWYWAEYSGPFEGFVKDDALAGGEPSPGMVIYAEPRATAPVITSFRKGDQLTISSAPATNGYLQVALEKTIGVYFNPDLEIPAVFAEDPVADSSPPVPEPEPVPVEPEAEPTVEPPPVIAPAVEPPPAVEPTPEPVEPERSQMVLAPSPTANPAPAPATTPAPPHSTSPAASPAAAPSRRVEPAPKLRIREQPIPPPPGSIDNSVTLRGTLAQAGRRWIFFAPKHEYVLLDGDGDRIAWIDLDAAVLARPLPELLNVEVTVYGEFKKIDGETEMVLLCRNVRPAF